MAQSFLDNPNVPLGLRNNNPGNLRPLPNGQKWLGELTPYDTLNNFSRFQDIGYGLRAMITDLLGDIVKDGNNTTRKLINSYAPANENNTIAYINSVCNYTGWSPDQKIPVTRAGITLLCQGMLWVELGGTHSTKITQNDFNEAFSRLGQTALNYLGSSPGGSVDLSLILVGAGILFFVLNKRSF